MSTNPAAAASTPPWYNIWCGKEISFQRCFEEGGNNLFDSNDKPGTVRIKPVYVKDRKGSKTLVRFKVKCEPWQAEPALNGLQLSPLGFEAPTIAQPLPVWKDSDNAIQRAYENALDPFIADLRSPNLKWRRLEGIYSVPVPQGGINVDLVQVLYFERAIVDGANLALVLFTLMQGASANQNGGGSGPPH